jgi:cellulose synthase/poly-beta-1,6-N-acetylglucosamine synthase-like glycosyltransferase
MEIGLALMSALVLTMYCIFLFEKPNRKRASVNGITKLKIIVPFKNERDRIQNLLDDLVREFARVDNVQVFFVDDNSEDESSDFIEAYLLEKDLHFLVLPSFGIGKKSAIETANQFSSLTDYILTLDADVRLPNGYAEDVLRLVPDAGLTVLTIAYPSPKSFLQSIVKIESLFQKPLFTGNAFGKKPSLCSGAHLLYPTSFFEHVQPYENNKQVRSGDDMFFLDACLKEKLPIDFYQLSVETEYPLGWKNLLQQRKRWLSKSSTLKSKYYFRSVFLFALLLSTPIVLFALAPIYGLLFLVFRGITEILFVMKHKAFTAPVFFTLPLFWLWQYCMPLLYIFGRRRDEQTW